MFMRIMKVIVTYDYFICRPSFALNLCKKYQSFMQVCIVICVLYMRNVDPLYKSKFV